MKLGNNANQISSLSSSKYVPNVHKCNSDCKHFGEDSCQQDLPGMGWLGGEWEKEREAERFPGPGRCCAGSRARVGLCAMGGHPPGNLQEALTPVKLS